MPVSDNGPSRTLDEDRTGYDPITDTYYAQHEWGGERALVTTIITTVTAMTNDDPTASEPMQEAIDLEALEGILRSLRESEHRSAGSVRFTFEGFAVEVRSDGEIQVRPGQDGDPPIQ